MANKYLKGKYSEVGELKKAFRDLLMVLHPDRNPSSNANDECAQLISEYESLITKIPKKVAVDREKNKPEGQRVYHPFDFLKMDQPFVDALMFVIGLKSRGANIEIEVCSFFFYVTGNTKPVKDELHQIGLKYQGAKQCWAFVPEWWKPSKGHKGWTMENIRQSYGSKTVNVDGQTQIG